MHERTCHAYLLFVTTQVGLTNFPRVRAIFTTFSSFMKCKRVTKNENIARTRENFVHPTCHE